MAHRLSTLKTTSQGLPKAADLILDPVLLVDNKTEAALPFWISWCAQGFRLKDADLLLSFCVRLSLQQENLMNKPIKERRKFLVDNMVEVGNRIKLSEIKHFKSNSWWI